MTLPALILNDPYAQWVKEGKKKIETRMNRLFKYRGDIVICCGKTNSVGPNRGKALCIVEIYHGRPMLNNKEEREAACITWHPDRKALLLRNWRHFSEDFDFAPLAVKRNFQGIFSITIPPSLGIIPKPEILDYDPCSTYGHNWKDEYYGNRCTKCDVFYPHGGAPWDIREEEGDELNF